MTNWSVPFIFWCVFKCCADILEIFTHISRYNTGTGSPTKTIMIHCRSTILMVSLQLIFFRTSNIRDFFVVCTDVNGTRSYQNTHKIFMFDLKTMLVSFYSLFVKNAPLLVQRKGSLFTRGKNRDRIVHYKQFCEDRKFLKFDQITAWSYQRIGSHALRFSNALVYCGVPLKPRARND